MEGGTVSRWNLAGTFLGTVTLSGFGIAGENSYPQNRGIAAFGSYWFTYNSNTRILSAWDLSGTRVDTTTLTAAGTSFDSGFSLSYANGKIFVVDSAGATWRGYDVGFTSNYQSSSGLLPTAVCPPWALTDTSSPEDPFLSGGNLVVGNDTNSELMFFIQTAPDIAIPSSLVIEARMRFVSGSSSFSSRAPSVIGFTTSANVGNLLFIAQDEIFFLAPGDVKGATAVLDTDGAFHTYRVEVTGSAINVFYDGGASAVLTSTTFTDVPLFGAVIRILWGELSTVALGTSHWEFFRHNASTVSCAPAAGCARHRVHGHISTSPSHFPGVANVHHGQHGHAAPASSCQVPHVPGHSAGLIPDPGEGLFTTNLTAAELDFVAAVNADGTDGPALRGTVVQLFGSAEGLYLDEQDQHPAIRFTAPGSPLYRTTRLPEVRVDGLDAEVLFSGLAPGLKGVWQINIRVPEGTRAGKLPVLISYDGQELKSVDVVVE